MKQQTCFMIAAYRKLSLTIYANAHSGLNADVLKYTLYFYIYKYTSQGSSLIYACASAAIYNEDCGNKNYL